MSHHPICLEGLSEEQAVNVIENVPASECELCRIIYKACAAERESIALEVSQMPLEFHKHAIAERIREGSRL